MLRLLLCVAVGMFVCSDLALAKKNGNEQAQYAGKCKGIIKSVSADTGSLTFTLKKMGSDKTVTVNDATKIIIIAADGTTKELKGKDGLKDPAVCVKAFVKVTVEETGVATMITLGSANRKAGDKK